MAKNIVNFVQPPSFRQLSLERAKSNRIAEITEKARRLRVITEVVDKFEQADIHEEEVVLNDGRKAVLFSVRDTQDDGLFVLKDELDSGVITRKQICDQLLGLSCQN
jgi:hypothetical protein